MDKSTETKYIKEEIEKCEELSDLKERILPMLMSQQELWAEKIREVIEESGCSKTAFAKKCNVSRVAVDKWCKGAVPRNRETFLRIGLAAGYDLARMNQLLARYGRYPELYSKSLEDCVCIYVISSPGDVDIAERLAQVHGEDALAQFIYDNIAAFSTAYQKFYAYVKMYVTINYQRYSSSIANLADGQGWSSSLKQCVSAIRQNKWYPTRNKILSLGLHLSMDREQIDEMLTLAHMEPLCAKNPFESVIIFILDLIFRRLTHSYRSLILICKDILE